MQTVPYTLKVWRLSIWPYFIMASYSYEPGCTMTPLQLWKPYKAEMDPSTRTMGQYNMMQEWMWGAQTELMKNSHYLPKWQSNISRWCSRFMVAVFVSGLQKSNPAGKCLFCTLPLFCLTLNLFPLFCQNSSSKRNHTPFWPFLPHACFSSPFSFCNLDLIVLTNFLHPFLSIHPGHNVLAVIAQLLEQQIALNKEANSLGRLFKQLKGRWVHPKYLTAKEHFCMHGLMSIYATKRTVWSCLHSSFSCINIWLTSPTNSLRSHIKILSVDFSCYISEQCIVIAMEGQT